MKPPDQRVRKFPRRCSCVAVEYYRFALHYAHFCQCCRRCRYVQVSQRETYRSWNVAAGYSRHRGLAVKKFFGSHVHQHIPRFACIDLHIIAVYVLYMRLKSGIYQRHHEYKRKYYWCYYFERRVFLHDGSISFRIDFWDYANYTPCIFSSYVIILRIQIILFKRSALSILRKRKLVSFRALQSRGCVGQPRRIRLYVANFSESLRVVA